MINKQKDSETFLKNIHSKQEKAKKPKINKRAKDPSSLMANRIELSQMSEWTDMGDKKKTYTRVVKKIDEKKLNSKMDREGLQFELVKYKKFAFQQYETIRLLRVEIMKIKKIAAIKDEKLAVVKIPGWVTNQDSNLMNPKDTKALREDISFLKETLNKCEEQNKLLKANSDKYERRAKYTLEKFKEIKAKEM